jgi:hypothetical protein
MAVPLRRMVELVRWRNLELMATLDVLELWT